MNEKFSYSFPIYYRLTEQCQENLITGISRMAWLSFILEMKADNRWSRGWCIVAYNNEFIERWEDIIGLDKMSPLQDKKHTGSVSNIRV